MPDLSVSVGTRDDCQRLVKTMSLLCCAGVEAPGNRGERLCSADGFPQLAAEDFSGGSLRDYINESDFSRLLVVGKAIRNERTEFLLHLSAIDKAVAQRDEGHRNFTGIGVGPADAS